MRPTVDAILAYCRRQRDDAEATAERLTSEALDARARYQALSAEWCEEAAQAAYQRQAVYDDLIEAIERGEFEE